MENPVESKCPDSLSYGDLYGGSILATILLIIAFIYLISFFYIKYKLNYLKDNWEDIKCNPLYMPFAGKIYQPTDQTESEFTDDNYNYCTQNILQGVAENAFDPVTKLTDVIAETFAEFVNSVNGMRNMFDYLRTQITEIFTKIYAQILVLLIPFHFMFKSLKDMMNKGNGVMLVGMQSLIGTYYTFGSFVSAIMNYMIFIIIGLYVAAFLMSFNPFGGAYIAFLIRLVANFLTVNYIATQIVDSAVDSSGIPPAGDGDSDSSQLPTQGSVSDDLNPNKNEGFTMRNPNSLGKGSIKKKREYKKQLDKAPLVRNTQVNTYPIQHEQEAKPTTIEPYTENDDSNGFDACFDENTLINLWGGSKKKIKFIKVGDHLTDDSYVTAIFKSTGVGHEYYSLNNVIVTGNHKLLYNDAWIPVHKHPDCIHLQNYETEFVYCMNTTTKKIVINSTVFADWDELDEYDMLELRIKMMKYTSGSLTLRNVHKYLDGGFHEETMIDLEDGNSVPISKICVNDVLRFGEKVLAIVKLDANQLNSVKEFYVNEKKIIGGYNLLFEEHDLGVTKTFRLINMDCDEHSEHKDLGILYHLVTDKASFYVNGVKFYDYNGCIEWILDKDNKNLLRKLLD